MPDFDSKHDRRPTSHAVAVVDAFHAFSRVRLKHPLPWRVELSPHSDGQWCVLDAANVTILTAPLTIANCVVALPDLLADELSPIRML